jgi:rhodanese-related sulfurtransferase
VNSVTYDQTTAIKNPLWLDVRTKEEFLAGSIPQAVHIPIDELRERIPELPRDRHLVVFCRVGFRAYMACRILQQSGFGQVSNLSGGYLTYGHYTSVIGSSER